MQISTNGGDRPTWSRDGKELFFISVDEKMMEVQVKTGIKFEAGVPKELFEVRFLLLVRNASFDVSNEGRFLIPSVVRSSRTRTPRRRRTT